MRWLIVGHVLPGNAEAVLRIIHQGVETMGSWYSRREDTQLLVIGSTVDHFFAPIAPDISAQHRVCFGAIVAHAIVLCSFQQTIGLAVLVIPFINGGAVEYFTE